VAVPAVDWVESLWSNRGVTVELAESKR
jgi:hypothetical protein